jgi:hypothetical protein
MTRSIFIAGIRKHLRHLQAAPGAPAELVDFLSKFGAEAPGAWLAVVEWWLRVAEQGRLHARGSRWMPAYQAGGATEHQLRLIHELGFQVEGRIAER